MKIVKNLIKTHKINNIKIIQNEKNSGVSFSRNEGIKISCGEYLMFLDADDELGPNNFLEEVNYLIDMYDTEYLLLKRNYYNKFTKPNLNINSKNLTMLEHNFYEVKNKISVALESNFPFGGSASAVIKSTVIENNYFDVSESRFEDWLYFFPLYLKSKVHFFDEVTININYDEKSLSNSKNSTLSYSYNLPKFYKYLESDKDLKPLRIKFFWIYMTGVLRNISEKDIDKLYDKYKN